MDIEETIYLSHTISKHGVHPDPTKVKGIMHIPSPKNKAEILAFQGTVNFLAKFLPRLSDKKQTIRDLVKQDVEFVWGRAQEESFETVKSLISKAPVLGFYDSKAELVIQCDGSSSGFGATLIERQTCGLCKQSLV